MHNSFTILIFELRYLYFFCLSDFYFNRRNIFFSPAITFEAKKIYNTIVDSILFLYVEVLKKY